MIFFLHGPDSFRSLAKKQELIKGFQEKRDPSNMNVVILDCQKEKEAHIFEELLAAPFLAEKRMVVLERMLQTKKTGFHKNIRLFLEEKKLPESTILVIVEEGQKFSGEAKKLFEMLKQEQYAQEFPLLTGHALERWIQSEISACEAQIEPKALSFLVANVESTWQANMVLSQLCAYAFGRSITVSDVQLFLPEAVDDNIFHLVDAIVSKNSKEVFSLIRGQYQSGQDSHYIFAMILRQFKILLQLKDAVEHNPSISPQELSKALSIHIFVVKKSLPLLKRYSLEELQAIHEELLHIDIKTKTGQGDQSLLLDFFVGKRSLTF